MKLTSVFSPWASFLFRNDHLQHIFIIKWNTTSLKDLRFTNMLSSFRRKIKHVATVKQLVYIYFYTDPKDKL